MICVCGHQRGAHDRNRCEKFLCCNADLRRPDHHDFITHDQKRCPCDGFVDTDPAPVAPPTETEPQTRLAVCKWLRDRIKVWEDEAKAELAMLPGERKSAMVNGYPLGFVTLTQGRKTVKVVNEAALVAFVAEHYPTELEQSVRPAFREKLLDQFKRLGALTDPDGVVHDGLIELVEGDPYPMTKLTADADRTMAEFLAAGRLSINGPTPTTNTTTEVSK